MSSGGAQSPVLVIGSGGREHALGWKLAQSPRVSRVILAPGNDGMPADWERWPVKLGDGKPEFARLAARAREAGVGLVVVGPDDPLAAGLVDVFEEAGLLTFGPRAAAARIEASKAFAKEVMTAAGVSTAKYVRVDSLADARKFLRSVPWAPQGAGWVLKADGLALGKGVVVCPTYDEAMAAVEPLIALSGSLVIEECLRGEELSWLGFSDGTRCALLEPARDYKRLHDADQGPNTGGMGAISPVPGVPAHFAQRVKQEIFEPVLRELSRRGVPFRGVLYAGLMVDVAQDKIWVIEFNARFGDPETQVLLPRIDGDLYEWCEAAARGDLSKLPAQVPFIADSAVVVVGAAAGYPARPEKGAAISGLMWPETSLTSGASGADGAQVFWAGVSRPAVVQVEAEGRPGTGAAGERAPQLVASGGRVLGSVGRGATLEQARARAYAQLKQFGFAGMQFRRDIGFFPEGRP